MERRIRTDTRLVVSIRESACKPLIDDSSEVSPRRTKGKRSRTNDARAIPKPPKVQTRTFTCSIVLGFTF